jgi:diguanylate cyclase (GGDEF)-like protein
MPGLSEMKKAPNRSPKLLKPPHRDTKGTAPSAGRAIWQTEPQGDQEKEALTEQAIRGAIYDVLTGLNNRQYFSYRIKQEIARANRNKHSLAILLCDLNSFKVMNEPWGRQSRGEVLRAVAKSIQEATRGTDLVFRWGEAEILVILSDTSPDGILITSDRVRKGVGKISEKAHLALDLSIGAALYPEHGSTPDELIHIAEHALSIAKKGKDKIHIGEEDYVLDEHSIKVVFQPVVDVKLNQLIGYEALSRDPEGKRPLLDLFKMNQLVGYEAFSRDPQGKLSILDLFKRYQALGQLVELKRICFRSQLKAAQEAALKRVFINVDFNVLGYLKSAPKPSDIEVILEISELEALHDIENHLKIARKWHEWGYKFAIDDFGAGYISLPFIAQLMPDYIKLDRSTILQAVACEKFRGFLKDLVLTLKNYVTAGFIAEGVETEKELQVVKDMGISYVQGFLLGRPEEIN